MTAAKIDEILQGLEEAQKDICESAREYGIEDPWEHEDTEKELAAIDEAKKAVREWGRILSRAFEKDGLGLPEKERKIGRWIVEENPTAGRCLQKVYICDICGSAVGCGYFNRRSFCPACGNEMEDPDGTPLTLDRYEEWKKKKAQEEDQRRQAQLEFCRSFREEDAKEAGLAPVTIEAVKALTQQLLQKEAEKDAELENYDEAWEKAVRETEDQENKTEAD